MSDDSVSRQAVIDLVEELETQRIKGRWEIIEDWDGDDLYRCSECGSMFTLIDGTPEDNDYNFCPSCGAWMIEEPYKGEQE